MSTTLSPSLQHLNAADSCSLCGRAVRVNDLVSDCCPSCADDLGFETAPTPTPTVGGLAELPWMSVDSSNLQRLAFVPNPNARFDELARGTLYAEFRSGNPGERYYAYENVPFARWSQLLAADSIGRYFNLEIKPNHPARRFDLALVCSEVSR